MKARQADPPIPPAGAVRGPSLPLAGRGLESSSPALYVSPRFVAAGAAAWALFRRRNGRTAPADRNQGPGLTTGAGRPLRTRGPGLTTGEGRPLRTRGPDCTGVARASFPAGVGLPAVPLVGRPLFRDPVPPLDPAGVALASAGLRVPLDPAFSGLSSGDLMGLAAVPFRAPRPVRLGRLAGGR